LKFVAGRAWIVVRRVVEIRRERCRMGRVERIERMLGWAVVVW